MTHVNGCTNQMMLYGCRNQKHMLLWSRPEDVVQILHRMYSFWFYVVSGQQPPNCKWLFGEWGLKKKKKKKCDMGWSDPSSFFSIEVQTGTDTSTSCYFHVLKKSLTCVKKICPPTFSWEQKGFFPQFSPALHLCYIKVFLYIFLWGNEPLTF